MSRSPRVARALVVVSILAIASVAAAAQNSEQVVFSGTGLGTFTPAGGSPTATPFGFWIWCEANSNNKYVGQCNGAMYFYALGITRGVGDGPGGITELDQGVYQINVVSKKDSSINCTLTNTVNVSCTAPAGTGQSTNSVVNVTGP